MLFTNILAGLAAITSMVSAAPTLAERQIADNEVKPWEITAVDSSRYRSGDRRVTVRLHNVNEYKLQAMPRGTVIPPGYARLPKFNATCTWAWNGEDNTPYGAETLCQTETEASRPDFYGNLTMTLQRGTGEYEVAGDFSLDIKETRDTTIYLQQYVRVWEGSTAFKRDDNLRIICGNAGSCLWSLRDDKKPFYVKQKLTKSVGSCTKAPVGGC